MMKCPYLLEQKESIRWDIAAQAWQVIGYHDIVAVLKSPDFSHLSYASVPSKHLELVVNQNTSFRKGVKLGFAKQLDWMSSIIQEELTMHLEKNPFDQIADIQTDYVVSICEKVCFRLCGMGGHVLERSKLKEYARDIFQMSSNKMEHQTKGNLSTFELAKMVQNKIRAVKNDPADDLISRMIHDPEMNTDITSFTLQLMVAMLSSVPLLIGNVLLELSMLEISSGYDSNNSLNTKKLYRISGPSQYIQRICNNDFDLKGYSIKKGDIMNLFLSNGNRDPVVFSQEERETKISNVLPHLSFGIGKHACMGVPLIHLMTETLILKIIESGALKRVLIDEIKFGGTDSIRGVVEMKIM